MKKKCAGTPLLRWLISLVGLASLCWSARAQAYTGLLIVEVGEADEQPALRLADLSDGPSQRLRVPQANDPRTVARLLASTDALQAVVFDSAARAVHVLNRAGELKTRHVEGDPPAPYVMAFVATELMALREPSVRPQVTSEPRSHLARLAARLALESNGAYAGEPMTRPLLGSDLWLAGKQRRYLALIGLDLGLPGHVRARRDGETLSIDRWDTCLRAGLVVATPRVRLLAFAESRVSLQHAAYRGAAGVSRRTTSLGLGAGAALELVASDWLSFVAGVGADWMARRSRYRVAGELALRERALLLTGSLGVLLTTRFR